MKSLFTTKGALMAATLLAMLSAAPGKVSAQACSGNLTEVSMANFVTTSNSVEFDVYIKNIGTTTLKLAAFGAGLVYSDLGVPAQSAGTFTVITAPAATGDFPNFNGIASIAHTNTASVVRHLRWTNNPVSEAVSVSLPSNVLKKFARFKFTSSVQPTVGTVDLSWVAAGTGYSTTQNVVYCNGNTTSTTLTIANTLINGINATAIALPLELIEFSGEEDGESNMLHWVTASEQGIANHILERSADGGATFNEIGRVRGQQNSFVNTPYSFEDKAPLAQSVYRLRSEDNSGQASYSKLVVITRKRGSFGVSTAYPSPTDGAVTVEFNTLEDAQVQLHLVDMMGRTVLDLPFDAAKGLNKAPLDLSALPTGTYHLTVQTGSSISEPFPVVKI